MREVPVADEALLAPVPLDLLEDAVDHGMQLVAFGSMAWEFFDQLTADRGAEPLDVLIYQRERRRKKGPLWWPAAAGR